MQASELQFFYIVLICGKNDASSSTTSSVTLNKPRVRGDRKNNWLSWSIRLVTSADSAKSMLITNTATKLFQKWLSCSFTIIQLYSGIRSKTCQFLKPFFYAIIFTTVSEMVLMQNSLLPVSETLNMYCKYQNSKVKL